MFPYTVTGMAETNQPVLIDNPLGRSFDSRVSTQEYVVTIVRTYYETVSAQDAEGALRKITKGKTLPSGAVVTRVEHVPQNAGRR